MSREEYNGTPYHWGMMAGVEDAKKGLFHPCCTNSKWDDYSRGYEEGRKRVLKKVFTLRKAA